MYDGTPGGSTVAVTGNASVGAGYGSFMAGRPLGTAMALVLALAAGFQGLVAQSVRGTVTAAGKTGQPVPGTVVILLDDHGAEVARTQSDEAGRYLVAGPLEGQYRLRFLVPGHRPLVSRYLNLPVGPPLDYPLQLTVIPPAMLDTLIVEGRPIAAHMVPFYRRRDFGRGRFLTRDDIDRIAASDISTLVRQLNMFDILSDRGDGSGPTIGQRGRGAGASAFCPVAIFVNGSFAGLSGEVDVDMILPLDGTEAVEAYRRTEAPPEFDVAVAAGRSASCGVLSAWSRISQRDTARSIRHLALSTHAGARLGSGGVRDGRFGFTVSYTIKGAIEFYPAVNVYRHVPSTVTNPIRSGKQIVLALRARLPRRDSPWYMGTGMTIVDASEQPGARFTALGEAEGQYHVLLTGFRLAGGRWQPYGELHVLDPLRLWSAQTSLFVGVARRFF